MGSCGEGSILFYSILGRCLFIRFISFYLFHFFEQSKREKSKREKRKEQKRNGNGNGNEEGEVRLCDVMCREAIALRCVALGMGMYSWR